jgi:hypothetical protein
MAVKPAQRAPKLQLAVLAGRISKRLANHEEDRKKRVANTRRRPAPTTL